MSHKRPTYPLTFTECPLKNEIGSLIRATPHHRLRHGFKRLAGILRSAAGVRVARQTGGRYPVTSMTRFCIHFQCRSNGSRQSVWVRSDKNCGFMTCRVSRT
jgi:hypothetical protein